MDLVPSDDPILSEELPRFDFENPPLDPSWLATCLAESMLFHNGIGLAANQVGWRHRLFVIRADPILACFNPSILDESEETNVLEEGCLSFKNLLIKIRRPNVIRVRYTQPNGETLTKVFQGMTARIFHHKHDHLNGTVFKQRATKLDLMRAKNQQKARI